MTDDNYKQFYDRVGKRIGWDFSPLEKIEEGKKWDFYDYIKFLNRSKWYVF